MSGESLTHLLTDSLTHIHEFLKKKHQPGGHISQYDMYFIKQFCDHSLPKAGLAGNAAKGHSCVLVLLIHMIQT